MPGCPEMTKNNSATLDAFLQAIDDPDEWRTVLDVISGERIKLSREDLLMIKRIHENRFASPDFDPFTSWTDFFTYKVMTEPLPTVVTGRKVITPAMKEKKELAKIRKLKRAILKQKTYLEEQRIRKRRLGLKPSSTSSSGYYDIWKREDRNKMGIQDHIPAPKVHLPNVKESYNPPSEYLPNEKELANLKALALKKKSNVFIPTRHSSFRQIPSYEGFIRERFERCLDLYLCPRTVQMKANMNPDDLLPVLPDPADLRPFPTKPSITFKHGNSNITALSVDPTGQWLLSGDESGMIKIWEVSTGKSLNEWNLSEPIGDISWNPIIPSVFACAFGVNLKVMVAKGIVNGWKDAMEKFPSHLNSSSRSSFFPPTLFECKKSDLSIKQITWHAKGDYFAAITLDSTRNAISFYQLSKKQSQNPFTRIPGTVRSIIFHPQKPEFYMATQRIVRHYDLAKKNIIRKISINNLRSIGLNSIDHNQLLVGMDDGHLRWYDMDYSLNKPYKSLNLGSPVKSCGFHPHYPLFFGHTDQTIQISHGKVYPEDFEKFPLIVPLKKINFSQSLPPSAKDVLISDATDHKSLPSIKERKEKEKMEKEANSHIGKVIFHPKEPWIFIGKKSGEIILYV